MLHVRVTRLLIVGMLFAFCLMAQRDLGTIAGTVTDPQGGVIPNAKVTIKEEATGLTYDVTTNTSGEFVRPALKPGNYTVTAEATGFRRVAQQNVVLVGGDRVAVPLSLPVGNVSESVEVSAQAPLLQTETTTLGADLESESSANCLWAASARSRSWPDCHRALSLPKVERVMPSAAVSPPMVSVQTGRTTSC
ncbi:MAG: carboxypeptidase-like regulatory domain-containing protein [Paludibaculum sp.]